LTIVLKTVSNSQFIIFAPYTAAFAELSGKKEIGEKRILIGCPLMALTKIPPHNSV